MRLYRIARAFGAHVQRQCIRLRVLHPERLDRPGGVIIAATHLGSLEPFFISVLADRPIRWMARIEFYRHPLAAWCLNRLMTFPVHRQGVPASSIRRAIALAERGEVVGIFPEGGVARGPRSMLLGGPAKGGACLVSLRTGRPIVPVAVVGTERLNRVAPWLPFRRGRVWIAVGEPIWPETYDHRDRRAARRRMACRLAAAFPPLHRELLERTDLGADPQHAREREPDPVEVPEPVA